MVNALYRHLLLDVAKVFFPAMQGVLTAGLVECFFRFCSDHQFFTVRLGERVVAGGK